MGEGVIKDLFRNFKLFAREKKTPQFETALQEIIPITVNNTALRQFIVFTKVHDYLKRKFAPGSIKKLTLSHSRLQLGIKIVDKPALVREVIAINFHVHFFLQHCKDKATSFANKSETSKAKKKGSTKKGGNNLTEGLSVLLGGGGDSSYEPEEPLLVREDLVCAGFFIYSEKYLTSLQNFLLAWYHFKTFYYKTFYLLGIISKLFITKLFTCLVSLVSDCFPYTTLSSSWFCQLYISF